MSSTCATHATAAAGYATPSVWRKPLLIAHIAVAVSLIGTDLALLALAVSGLQGADPHAVYPAASQVASWVIGPLVVLALVTGIAQAVLLRWGVARYWWVAIKLAVTVVFTGLVWFVLIPRLADSADAATTGHVFTTDEKLPLAVVPAAAVAGLLVLVGLAVYKPPARLRRPRRATVRTPMTEEVSP